MIDFGYTEPTPPPERPMITQNVSGGLVGLQPYPGAAPESEADGSTDYSMLFECVTRAPEVVRSYSETFAEACDGDYIENYGYIGGGACLPDQTLGPARMGYRGMNDEELPIRPPRPDEDADYDERPY